MPIKTTPYIWFNGKMIPWENATVHVMTHALHYGSSVFEGIRCYETPRGPAIFRLTAHLKRLQDSAKIYRMEIPFSLVELTEAGKAIIRDNKLTNAYIRPLVWRGYGEVGVLPLKNPVEAMFAAFEWGAYLGVDALENGVDVAISSWTRMAPNTIPTLAKAGGNYLSSQMIVMEAQRNGYAEGIALDVTGNLSEGSGENLFVIRNNVIYTPPIASALLPGITRDTVMTLAKEVGYEVQEQVLPRESLYLADEVFFSGTAAEITPVRSVDRMIVGSGKRGPITAAIQGAFSGLFNGETTDQWGWLDYV